jgi:hypothetical protein
MKRSMKGWTETAEPRAQKISRRLNAFQSASGQIQLRPEKHQRIGPGFNKRFENLRHALALYFVSKDSRVPRTKRPVREALRDCSRS